MKDTPLFPEAASFLIRDYRSTDYPDIVRLWDETGLGGSTRGDDQQIIERSLALGGRLLVVVTDGNAVRQSQKNDRRNNFFSKTAVPVSPAILIATSWMTYDGRRFHLHHLGVSPAWQRRGIGRLLTLASIAHARESGVQIKLEVHQHNAAALALYRSCGFEYLGDYDVYIIRNP